MCPPTITDTLFTPRFQERLTKKRCEVHELVMVEEGFVERNGKMEDEEENENGIWGKV
jgi:hypothetical protein